MARAQEKIRPKALGDVLWLQDWMLQAVETFSRTPISSRTGNGSGKSEQEDEDSITRHSGQFPGDHSRINRD